MRALHPLAPAGRWELLDERTQSLTIQRGWVTLHQLEKADGWWELGTGADLVRWKAPGYRKPWVCMSVLCRELSQLDLDSATGSPARQKWHDSLARRAVPCPACGARVGRPCLFLRRQDPELEGLPMLAAVHAERTL